MAEKSPVLDHWQVDPWDDPAAAQAVAVEEVRSNRRGLRWVVYSVGMLVIVALVAAGLLGLWYIRKVNPTGNPGAAVTFTVNKGDDVDAVAERLAEKGLISDVGLFKFYVDRHGGLTLTEGYYRIRPNDHMGNVMRVLSTPPSATFTKVTFPEGYTIARMARRLHEKLPVLAEKSFDDAARSGAIRSKYMPAEVTSLEGMLFPDTYQVSNSETVTNVMRRMVRQFDRVADQERIDEKAKQLFASPYQVIIVASMIEREAKSDADRPLIARVIYNRLSLGMPLGIDATSLYDQPPGTKITAALLASDSPYNTRLRPGLPPTPIANPGQASLRAALNPAPALPPNDPKCNELNDDEPCMLLYYVLKDELGNHEFNVTIAQHEAAVQRARDLGLLE